MRIASISIAALLLTLSFACSEHEPISSGPQPVEKAPSRFYERLPLLAKDSLPATDALAIAALNDGAAIYRYSWRWPNLLAQGYGAAGSLHFVTASGLSPLGEEALAVLEGGLDDAMWPEELHLDRIHELNKSSIPLPPIALEPGEQEVLIKWLEENPQLDDEARFALAIDAEQSPVSRWQQRFAAAQAANQAEADRLLELELAIADALLCYGDELWAHNLAAETDGKRLAFGDPRLRRARLVELMEALPQGELGARFAELMPKDIQYQRLREALKRYREIKAEGGWPQIEVAAKRLPLRRGHQGEVVELLQRRLAAEGYFQGPIDGKFGEALRDGLEAYQLTHQLDEDGDIDEEDLASLNRSVDYRIAQIEVSLDRWRDSRIGDDTFYIHVNVPDFHAEVWKDGERAHRFKVIVGNTGRYFSEERDDYVYINRTPLISAKMDFIIFNPYWNVPPRIVRELRRKEAEEPGHLEAKGYEVRGEGNSMRIRQPPGPDNALGMVKFQFPNRYDIYMHDTPRRNMFKHEIRAFSHGCVRVHEPLELAEVLFKLTGRRAPGAQVKKYLSAGEEDWTQLDEHIPVHIEYYVVRVDTAGRAHFGADVYRYDQALVDERLTRRGLGGELDAS